jgi:uncharacterized protein (TIGR03435 family)
MSPRRTEIEPRASRLDGMGFGFPKLLFVGFLTTLSCSLSFAQTAEFEAASIRPSNAGGNRRAIDVTPGRIAFTNVSLRQSLLLAYDVKDYQLSTPDWMRTEYFNITAKAQGAASNDEMRPMLQRLLTTRFQMEIQRETRELPVYAMVVAKTGTKMRVSQDVMPAGTPGRVQMNGGGVTFSGVTIQELVDYIIRLPSAEMDRPVIDKTGLTGRFDFSVNLFGSQEEMRAAIQKGDFGSSIFTLIQEQLGLKLEPEKVPIDFVVVSRAEKVPVEN